MHTALIAGDLGNSTLQLGEFILPVDENPSRDVGSSSPQMPVPYRTFQSSWDALRFEELNDWLRQRHGSDAELNWRLGSVNRPALHSLQSWILDRNEFVHIATHTDFAMPINQSRPERVGIDRIAAAFAANVLRKPHQAAIIVDAGTAITIDCVTAAGEFLGGAIAPGMQLGLDALSTRTDQLPLTNIDLVPPLIGNETAQAIRAGVYWMTTQGINGLIDKLQTELASPCSVIGTGGSMPWLLPNLNHGVQHVPHLVLSGLALAKP